MGYLTDKLASLNLLIDALTTGDGDKSAIAREIAETRQAIGGTGGGGSGNVAVTSLPTAFLTDITDIKANTAAANLLAAVSPAILDIPAASITTSVNSAPFTPTWGISQVFSIVVGLVTGAGATLSVTIQESLDNLTWQPVYTFPLITASGTYNSPFVAQTGRVYRYAQIVNGTTPSFNRSISRHQSNIPVPIPGREMGTPTFTTSPTVNISTTALAANPNRKYLFIQNLSSAVIFITTGATAANNTGIRLAPNGGSQEFAVIGAVPTNAIRIICPTLASAPFTVVEG